MGEFAETALRLVSAAMLSCCDLLVVMFFGACGTAAHRGVVSIIEFDVSTVEFEYLGLEFPVTML
jgi:hypothetical protein